MGQNIIPFPLCTIKLMYITQMYKFHSVSGYLNANISLFTSLLLLWMVDCSFRLLKCSLTFTLEPDVGMQEKDAHKFFQQLIAAVVSETDLCVDVLSGCWCCY